MEFKPRLLLCVWAAVLWGCVLSLQRPPPRYSQQYMPETSFSCRNKIVGSYYADPETDCQVFHVCVSVAGSIQDYKFLCPNDTAFDQESQTCADWYDVDCEAATLYYASDNFDLYRIGSGLESVHYDQLRSDAEPQDHLQRSETSDPVRSANSLKYSASDYNNKNTGKDLLKGSSSSNFYNRNNKEDEYETERPFKEEESKKKSGVRKVSRKQQYNGNGANNYASSSTTAAPPPAPANSNTYTGFYSGSNFNNQRSSTYAPSTARPAAQDNHGRSGQRYNAASSTARTPTTYQDNSNYQSSTTGRSTYNYNQNYNQQANYNQQSSNYQNGNYNQQSSAVTQSTTARPTTYKNSYQSYNGNQFTQTTAQPSTNYQQQEYTNYQPRNYNNVQRSSSYQSSTPAPTAYENYNGNQYRSTGRQESSPTTAKYYPNYASSSYAPTTYSPATKKYATESPQNHRNENGQQYYEKNGQAAKSSTQYYDSTKAPKKATQYSNYEGANGGKYYSESSTGTYELSRSSPVGIGFSPASINHLAESPRSTTPVPRRPSSATTYNPNSYNTNSQRGSQQSVTTPRSSTYVSGSARPFTSTTRYPSTTARPKSGKKNDYDYAYYDNAGGLEYDGLELEHVTGNKESSKISRN